MNTFVFDLDDTLLNRNKAVGNDTQRELLHRQRQGDTLVLATARPIRAVRRFVDPALLQIAYVITLNGAVLHSPNGQITRFAAIGDRATAILQNVAIARRVHFSVELAGETFATNAIYTDEELDRHQSATRGMVLAIDQVDSRLIAKLALDGLGENIADLLPTLTACGLYPIPCMNDTFINVVDPAVDKSSTLQHLLHAEGLTSTQLYVFGDDIPDIRVMKLATQSIAMANAHVAVKAIADVIIGDCDSDGIGAFIRGEL